MLYNLVGQRIRELEVTCTYNAAGNLLTKLTAELKKRISADVPITYTYDYEWLSEVLIWKNQMKSGQRVLHRKSITI